ncbi:sensor domain-containing diguanylate cyclase [Metabacillus fastidiosus]|uniref:Sensor domain-containing diguanylate cyclase n=2 Tax=Metabacillus fastidiosus TaxID=1458 RepID=A0ABU6P2M6_9BACI|nr:sensor domain-containing diguanylate cyclase [Metabacillus fastidiosus]MED4402401.1 sensor domain-containing diguanylate cyclase [Metabacillus fastidiosus]MED4462273.1 sensor domain-containing diguanylate cyclase [Metabacillus fastidiosus]
MKILFNRKFKLTTLLISLISASVLLTTIILLFASYQSERKSLIDTHLSLSYSKSEKISNSVNSLFKSMRISLQETTNFLSNNPEMTDKEIQEQLELLKNNSRYFNSLSWVDETGTVRNIAPISVGLKGKTITGITRDVIDSKTSTLTTPYKGPTGRIVVLISEPFYDSKGKYRGIIGGSIYLQERNVLNEILGNDMVDHTGSYYYVVGPDGKLLFHPDVKRIGEDVGENPMLVKLLQGESGKQHVINTKGVPMLAAYNFIPEIGWGVVQQTPVSYIDELLKKHIQNLILTILLPFLILMLVSLSIARKLAKPFIYLADVVNQFGSKNQIQPPVLQSHWNREADLLTKSVVIAMEAVEKNNKKLVEEAMTDSLTNLPNRRKLNEVMTNLANDGQLFSLVTLDIDHFKSVNDTYGHQDGDEVLKYLAKTVQLLIREKDMFFRYGGEEFILLLPDTKSLEAYNVAEKIRTAIENTISPIGKPITISLGISEFPLHSNLLNDLFLFADKALYQSKSEGRNLTTIWSLNLPIK